MSVSNNVTHKSEVWVNTKKIKRMDELIDSSIWKFYVAVRFHSRMTFYVGPTECRNRNLTRQWEAESQEHVKHSTDISVQTIHNTTEY